MTETSHVHGIKRHTNSNYVYYMCLLDWHGVILPEDDHRRIAYELIPNGEPMDGWLVASSNNETLTQSGLQHEYLYGYYHSRLIFRFALEAPPRDILEVRTLRQSTDKFVKEFLQKKIPHSINELQLLSTELQIFLYPVFELSSDCQLWRSKGTLPYSFPTTCFYAELPDIGRRFWLVRQMPFVGRLLTAEVRIRISGAKIITSPMSDMFFWNLINLIYHEGLYRQSRTSRNEHAFSMHEGLENRLEDFADELMTSFNQSLSNVVQASLNIWLIIFTVFILILTIVLACR